MAGYKIHPFAEIFPEMSEVDFSALKQSIQEHGVQDPIAIWNGFLVDGRHRWRACQELGIGCKSVEMTCSEDEIRAFVISKNLHRRHLDVTQRAMVAARLATLKRGGDRKSEEIKVPNGTLILEEAADLLNVGRRTVARAKKVLESGSQELIAAVDKGEIKASAALKVIEVSADKAAQTKLLEQGKDAIKEAVEKNKKPRRRRKAGSSSPQTPGLFDGQAAMPVGTPEERVLGLWPQVDQELVFGKLIESWGGPESQAELLYRNHRDTCVACAKLVGPNDSASAPLQESVSAPPDPLEALKKVFTSAPVEMAKELLEHSKRLYKQVTGLKAYKKKDIPTLEQVREFCKEQSILIDPEEMFDYYESQGWNKANGLPVENWKSCVRNWSKKDRGLGKAPKSMPVKAVASLESEPEFNYEAVKARLAQQAAKMAHKPKVKVDYD